MECVNALSWHMKRAMTGISRHRPLCSLWKDLNEIRAGVRFFIFCARSEFSSRQVANPAYWVI